ARLVPDVGSAVHRAAAGTGGSPSRARLRLLPLVPRRAGHDPRRPRVSRWLPISPVGLLGRAGVDMALEREGRLQRQDTGGKGPVMERRGIGPGVMRRVLDLVVACTALLILAVPMLLVAL